MVDEQPLLAPTGSVVEEVTVKPGPHRLNILYVWRSVIGTFVDYQWGHHSIWRQENGMQQVDLQTLPGRSYRVSAELGSSSNGSEHCWRPVIAETTGTNIVAGEWQALGIVDDNVRGTFADPAQVQRQQLGPCADPVIPDPK